MTHSHKIMINNFYFNLTIMITTSSMVIGVSPELPPFTINSLKQQVIILNVYACIYDLRLSKRNKSAGDNVLNC